MSGKLIYLTDTHISTPLLVVMAEYIAKGDNRFHNLVEYGYTLHWDIEEFRCQFMWIKGDNAYFYVVNKHTINYAAWLYIKF
jgi:hypothetical protein